MFAAQLEIVIIKEGGKTWLYADAEVLKDGHVVGFSPNVAEVNVHDLANVRLDNVAELYFDLFKPYFY